MRRAAAMAAGARGEGLNPGESFTLAADDLFTPPTDGYTVSIGAAASPGGPVALTITGGGIEVAAVKAGESTVTVTATAFESAASPGARSPRRTSPRCRSP